MAGFFRWLSSGAQWVGDAGKDGPRIFPVYGRWRGHPAIGKWYPRDGVNGSGGAHHCTGCGALADRSWLSEVPQPEDESTVCSVLMDRENETRRRHGLPPVR